MELEFLHFMLAAVVLFESDTICIANVGRRQTRGSLANFKKDLFRKIILLKNYGPFWKLFELIIQSLSQVGFGF